MASVTVNDQKHWHELRSKNVGASEVSALFALSPWVTRWQLYMLKSGQLPDVFDNKSMAQGRHFEPAVASYAQEKFGIRLRKVNRYLTSDSITGMGASLDYEEYGSGYLVPTELKFSLWGDGWEYDGEELTAIPDYYMLQVQHQLGCCPGAPHAQLIAFVGSDLKRMIIPRSPRLITAIEVAVRQFWDDIAAGKEPPVDFSADADAVSRLAFLRKLRTVTLPPAAETLMRRLEDAKRIGAEADKQEKEARTELLKMIIDAGTGDDSCVATVGPYRLAVSKVKDNPGRVVDETMIGEVIGARKGHVRLGLKRVEA